ncbi:DUF4124 domain-containing protein [Pseudoduganella chitinolytica]|uniref:DUF4124 domain-containing protein n=1 Tax=Pseudoduganella chitinolytica TaxID=34070 RepID=A0ABY8B4R1_9BURK|nr:DUF4124 domain-containing protein [Pseudoduganella chitinolytica]WEF30775.1 DUF4124 domain-containing protein [Pseudoduganella chitinolytica]
MKIRRISVPVVLLSTLLGSTAQAQIYRCVDASGHKEYTDRKKGSHCVALDLPDPVIAAPPKREGQPRPRPATSAAAATPAPAPSAFPRVDSAEQKARDADRRQILTDELNAEMTKLGELRREFNNGEPERRGDERNYAKYQERVANLKTSIARSEQNVEALKREIANIR